MASFSLNGEEKWPNNEQKSEKKRFFSYKNFKKKSAKMQWLMMNDEYDEFRICFSCYKNKKWISPTERNGMLHFFIIFFFLLNFNFNNSINEQQSAIDVWCHWCFSILLLYDKFTVNLQHLLIELTTVEHWRVSMSACANGKGLITIWYLRVRNRCTSFSWWNILNVRPFRFEISSSLFSESWSFVYFEIILCVWFVCSVQFFFWLWFGYL